ncbi:hypothetical protein CALVIDRAFT_534816 [Calocera viscosa TUFC12733]|uniref:Uncharacterized protein n=1 Tax=Calocera viscosa (strain TUFC12733) TaxID=1330018 RepID=A0A167PF67_CALVF|nr:hypothetical protein CALVIDRAFT_534816 [Calocera viscosa TUFC12733]
MKRSRGPVDNCVIRGACQDVRAPLSTLTSLAPANLGQYRAGPTNDLKADLPLLEHAKVVSAFSPGAPKPPA